MNDVLLEKLDTALGNKDMASIRLILKDVDVPTLTFLVDHLSRGKRKTFSQIPPETQAALVLNLSEESKKSILPRLPNTTFARFLHFNYEDDAADILQWLPKKRLAGILEKMKDDKRKKIEKLLYFDSQTAGGLMDLNFIVIAPDAGFKEVAEKAGKYQLKEGIAPTVVVRKENGGIMGYLPYRSLILHQQIKSIKNLVHALPLVASGIDQKDVLALAQDTRSEVIGVTGDGGQIIGIIQIQDLLWIAEEEATEDVYQFAGVDEDEDISDSMIVKVKRRYLWLIINLGTAFLAASVVSIFQGTIEKMAILAIYMPIVAGMGGNAATQTLAVVVRGLALGNIPWHEARKIIVREGIAGVLKGIILGSIAAGVAYIFGGSIKLGLVLGFAMIINMFVAGFFGATFPFILKRLKIDPAVASSIFVTTATDIFGFFAFLGLATIFLI